MSPGHERVFVVDDDPAVLKGICRLLRSAGLEALPFSSPQEFLARVDLETEGCAVLDLAMPGLDGLTLQRELSRRGSGIPVVFLTGHGDVPTSVQALKNGAADFLTKPVEDAVLLQAVRAALDADRTWRAARRDLAEIRRRLETLTPREREVLEGVVSGRLNKQVGSELGITEKTVKVHRGRVMEKMGASSLADLVRLAERAGIGT